MLDENAWTSPAATVEDPARASAPVEMTTYDFARWAVQIKGEPLDMTDRPWMPAVYDSITRVRRPGYPRKTLLMFARQCEKSTTISNVLMGISNLVPYARALYVTASDPQLKEFSHDRLKSIIADSPVLHQLSGDLNKDEREAGADRKTQNVLVRRWANESQITLRSVFAGPDRCRGIFSDILAPDEIQDISSDDLPVIEECLFRCRWDDGPISIYSGTPKSFSNHLNHVWERESTQTEWMVRCQRCRYWNTIEFDNVEKNGLVCRPCGNLLNPIDDGRWVSMGDPDSAFQGFRLPQPVVIYSDRRFQNRFRISWNTLFDKKKRRARGKFENENMARPWDVGTKPVTFAQVRTCAINVYKMLEPNQTRGLRLYAGIDWGTGTGTGYTLLSIWGYDGSGRFRLVYAKRYEGSEADPEFNTDHIIAKLTEYRVARIGADWGFGFHVNPKLMKRFGAEKFFTYMHSTIGEKVKWDEDRCTFLTNKTRVLRDVFSLIKKGPVKDGVAFPNWDEFKTFAADIFAEEETYSERTNLLHFDHPKNQPDDFLHTFCYAFLVSQLDIPRPDLLDAP